jgi:hypothetical protein
MNGPKSRTLVWNESAPPPAATSLPPTSAPTSFAALDRPASEFLALVPWDGPLPDADAMPAREFLAWL